KYRYLPFPKRCLSKRQVSRNVRQSRVRSTPRSGRRTPNSKALFTRRRPATSVRLNASETKEASANPRKANGGDETIAGYTTEHCVRAGIGRIALAGDGQRDWDGKNWVVFVTFVGHGRRGSVFQVHAPQPQTDMGCRGDFFGVYRIGYLDIEIVVEREERRSRLSRDK